MQPLAFGVIVMVAVPLFTIGKEFILFVFVPLPARPIAVLLFIQSNVTPFGEPLKVTRSEFSPLHLIWSVGFTTVGVGFAIINILSHLIHDEERGNSLSTTFT